jgi:hypothetical protein
MSANPNRWPMQRAKEHSSALLRSASAGGDQAVTADHYGKLCGDARSVWDATGSRAPQDADFAQAMREIEEERRTALPEEDDLSPDFSADLAP